MRASRIGSMVAVSLLLFLQVDRRSARAQTPPPRSSTSPSASPTPSAPAVVVLPHILVDPGVTYPAQALSDGLHDEVIVVLTLEIDATGAVQKATVDAPHGHGFDEAAVSAATKATFSPATRGGVPFAARIKFQYVFRPPKGTVAAPNASAPAAASPVSAAPATPAGATTPANGASSPATNKPAGQATTPGTPSGKPAPAVVDVDVRGERLPREVTKRTLSGEELAVLPGTGGDALKSLQALPGVARPPPFGSQLIVRGSAPRDTHYVIDGTSVPLVYHLGGLSSVIPTEVIDRLDFYPGNFSAAYGRGMGGLVDVGIRDPKSDRIHAMAQIDLIDARALAEGPILDTGWKLLLAGRRSWFDAWLGPVLEARGSPVTVAPRYYDYQVALAKDLTPRSSFRLLFFGSDDAVDLVNPNPNVVSAPSAAGLNSHISFWRLQARYENRLQEGTQLRAVVAGGIDSDDHSQGLVSSSTSETPISGRIELSQKVVRGIVANVGIDVLFAPYDVHIRRPARQQTGGPLDPPRETSQSGTRYLTGTYTEWEIQPWRGLRLVPGLRLDYTSSTRSWDLSPRINVRQDVGRGFPRTTLKAGVGLFYQPPEPLETDPVFGQANLRSNRSVHADFGVEQELSRQIELSVDVFYKSLEDLVEPAAGNVGRGFAFGTEWLLRYKPDEHFFGWIAYTLSRSERARSPGDQAALTDYDQTHILTVLGSYDFGHGFRAGLRFRLVSGNPYTPIYQGAYNATVGVYYPAVASPANAARLPLFHQLDLRVDKTWKFTHWSLTTYLDLQNVYDRENVETLSYSQDYRKSVPVTGLPIIPSLGLRGEL